MGSANNCCSEVFLLYFIFNMENSFLSGAISDRSVGKDQSCFGKNMTFPLSVIVDVSFVFIFFFRFLFYFIFSYLQQNQKIDKKSELTQEEKLSLVILCQYIVFSLFSLGMLWWTAVNLYSSCKLIVRKLYRFLYFGRKVFFSL